MRDGAIRYAIPRRFLNTFITFGVFPLVRRQTSEGVEKSPSSSASLKTAPDCHARCSSLLNSYKNSNCILALSIAIAVFSTAAVQNGKPYLVIASIETNGEIQHTKRISYRSSAAGNQRVFWPELTTRPWAPPFPSEEQSDASRGDESMIIADREYPEVGLRLERLGAHSATQMNNALIVKYSAHGALGADGYAPTTLDESGIRAISIDGKLEVLFDAETRLPIAAKYDLTRTVLPALWREGIALDGITEHVSVAWSAVP